VDSDDPGALTVSGGGIINASVVKIVGGYNTNGGGILTPVPSTSQAVTPDPFAALPAPAIPNRCDSNGINGGATPTPNAVDHIGISNCGRRDRGFVSTGNRLAAGNQLAEEFIALPPLGFARVAGSLSSEFPVSFLPSHHSMK
jgi:hypothetical protein